MEVAGLYWPVECRHEGLLGRAALPNQHYPSDHLPIGALLRLKHFYVPPYGDVHAPAPPEPGAGPVAVQDACNGQEGVEEAVLLGGVEAPPSSRKRQQQGQGQRKKGSRQRLSQPPSGTDLMGDAEVSNST